MHLDDEDELPEDRHLEALMAFDEDLAAGRAASPNLETDSSLLAVHHCQALLERVWPRSLAPTQELPGTFGRFYLERELGRGGFGVVYLATDTKLKRKVALKIPHPGVVLTPEFHRRFLREGEAASRLDHPHIVPIYEIGEHGGICYIASAFCDGITMAEWLSRRSTPVPPRIAADLLVKLAVAVGHAHERGILHRDLKPKNLILQGARATTADQDERELTPRICDFGLAKILDQDIGDTCTGVPIGSPAYMAPEQASGRNREISPATDIYALGVILYEILVGRTPFQGETVLETLGHISDIDPPSPRTLRPGLPRDLDTICMKCLEKRPERRYASADALAADLGRFLEGRPVMARPVSGWVRSRKWVRRHPALSTLAGIFALVILGTIAGLAWTGARERYYNITLRKALDQTLVSEQRAHRLWVSGQIRLAQFHHDLGNVETASEILANVRPEAGLPDPQGFAWAYLNRLCRNQIPQSIKLPIQVYTCAIAANARTVAFGDTQGDIHLWDVVAGSIKSLKGQSDDSIIALEFTPDGRTLASASPHSVKIWDVDTGDLWPDGTLTPKRSDWLRFTRGGEALTSVFLMAKAEAPVTCAWRLDLGKRRVIPADSPPFSWRSTLRPPSISTKEHAEIPGITDLAATADGQILAVNQGDGTFLLVDHTSRQSVGLGRWKGDEVVFVTLSPADGERPDPERIRGMVQQVTGRQRVRRLAADLVVREASFSPDGASIAIFSIKADGYFGELSILDVASGRFLARYSLAELTPNRHQQIRFAADGRLLIILNHPTKAVLWQWRDRVEPPVPAGHKQELWSLAYSPDGRTLASSSDDATIKLWDASNASVIRTLKGHASLVTSIAFSPDGRLLASAGFDKTVRIWEVATGTPLAVLEGHTGPVRSVAFRPDGKLLASTGNDGTVRLWDVSTRTAHGEPLKAHTLILYSVAFSPDGRFLCSAGDDRKICVWEASTGRLLREYASENGIQSLIFSPDGTTLATSSVDGGITLWDMNTGSPRNRLFGHSLEVLGLAFSPDGSTLASVGRDMTVRLWDAATGQEQLTLKGHKHRVHTVAFSPDGSTLASGSFDGRIKLWRSRDESQPH